LHTKEAGADMYNVVRYFYHVKLRLIIASCEVGLL